ncbi:MAG: methyltransferase [Hyphomicrobiales bacterium]|nr:methyltransferase [Hyphomicrobiales bacterium]MBV9112235.1 methyltransferase [Hyphomicrobiales bacterium]MBV9517521.1 methyltransferase [Hyphomicrobiales bacterium]
MAGLPPGFSSSNDVGLDRRYRWAKAALDAGESREACEILRQSVAEAPSWAPAWKLLGDALVASGEPEQARGAYERTDALDHAGRLGARLELARLGAIAPKDAMQKGYVAALFDEYSDRFDAHLLERLNYRAPDLMLRALREVCATKARALRFEHALDLGCGTGLMGEAIRPFAGLLTGADLSSGMLAKARAKLVYDDLFQGEIVEFLRARPRSGADLILAADVLVYISDLQPLFAAVAAALCPRGLFAFTVQSCDEAATLHGYLLGLDNRFAHSQAHLRKAAASQTLEVAHLANVVTRHDAGRDVQGFMVVLASAR